MIACRYLYFLTLFLSIFEWGDAQKLQVEFNLVTGMNGVPIGKITGITQDKFGYMWFVDQINHCLIRYDGSRMKTFRNSQLDTNSLNSTGFECIAADSTGGIWVDAVRGVDKFDPNTEKFIHYRFTKTSGESYTNVILVDHSGFVWIGTNDGLYQLDPKTGKFVHYQHQYNNPTSLSCNTVRSLYEDHQGVLWIGTGFPFDMLKEGGLNKLDRATGKFTRYIHDPTNPSTLINNKVRAIFEDSRGTFWIGTQGDGLHTMDRKTGNFTRLTYDPNHPGKLSRPPVKDRADHITFIKEDLSGKLWIGTYSNGLVRYDPVSKEIEHYHADKKMSGFTDSTSWCAFNSRDGVLWIAVEGTNLFRVDPSRKSIPGVSTVSPVTNFLEDKDGYLWVSTTGNGLLKFDSNYKLIRQFKHDPADPFSLLNNDVGILFQNQDDTIWVGTRHGLRKFNTITENFYAFHNKDDLKDSADIGFVGIIEDKKGVMWFTRWGLGLISYDTKKALFKHYLPDEKDSSSIVSNQLNCVLEDHSGGIWVSGSGGISRFDRKTEKFKRYLPDIFTTYLFEDSRNELWAGSARGLFLYNEKEDRFESFFDPQTGIYSVPSGSIIEDNEKNLWLSMYSAIMKLNPVTKETFIYGSRYGISPNSIAPWTRSYKDSRGKILFPHESGFYAFYPDQLSGKTGSKIIITDLFINNRRILHDSSGLLQKPVEEISDLDLKYNQNNIAFNFAAIEYRNPEDIKYSTMLEGYDNTWREITGEKSSSYFNVGKGKYVYRIRAFSSDGSKSEKTIVIWIHPPWWETWWAYTLYALLLILTVWAFIKWRTRNLKKEKLILEEKVAKRTNELKQEKEIVESTLTELKSAQAQLIHSEKMASLGELTAGIAHEIQNPLNFVNNFSEVNKELLYEMKEEIDKGNLDDVKEIAGSIIENEEKIIFHGKRADAIVKGMLQHSRSSTGIKEPTDINALADEYLRLAYHGLRAKDKSFNSAIKTDFDQTVGNINIIPQDIGRVILNLITNAFYAVTEKQKQVETNYQPIVSVQTKKIKNGVEIRVIDNGNGIPQDLMDKIFQPFFTTKPTGEGTGLGLSLSYDIVKAHGGELKVETKKGGGSEFIIRMPS